MTQTVLLVEPDAMFAAIIHHALLPLADVHHHSQFETARIALLTIPFAFIVTNLRLRTFNGLHLVHLAKTLGTAPPCVVYGDDDDLGMAYEVKRAGAFYETRERVPVTAPGYLRGMLPNSDRRDLATRDRRLLFRGGRRRWDREARRSR